MNIDQMCEDARKRIKHSIHTRAGMAKKAIAESFEQAWADLRKRQAMMFDASGDFRIGTNPSAWDSAPMAFYVNGVEVFRKEGA